MDMQPCLSYRIPHRVSRHDMYEWSMPFFVTINRRAYHYTNGCLRQTRHLMIGRLNRPLGKKYSWGVGVQGAKMGQVYFNVHT